MTTRVEDHTFRVIRSAIDLHRNLGPGLLESVYEALLHRDLLECGIQVDRQVAVTFAYKGIECRNAFRIDLLVERSVVVEVKSVEHIKPVHKKQLLTYLSLTKLRIGLILNFVAPTLKEGLCRIVNDLHPDDSPLLRVNLPSLRNANRARLAKSLSDAAPEPPAPNSQSDPPAPPASTPSYQS